MQKKVLKRYNSNKFLITFLLILGSSFLTAQIKINEIMSSNSSILRDEDGDYPDWLELYNAGSESGNLSGYGLSDNEDNPYKWLLPDVVLQPKEYLLIFASGKDRRLCTVHWETVITQGDEWKYRIGAAEIPSNWHTPEYDDSAWLVGPSGFGYGDGDDATTVANGTISVFVRKNFIINDLNKITDVILHVDFDDGFVAYLNGVEIARANIGSVGTPPTYNQTASDHEAGTPIQYKIIDFQTLLRTGDNLLAAQVHNNSSGSSDLSLIPYLTLGMTEIPDNPRGIPDFINLQSSFLHTNFKIDADGETLTLSAPGNLIIDQVETGNIPPDVSRGRQPDGTENWYFFYQPTPGSTNSGPGYTMIATEPLFSKAGGFFSNRVELTLSNESNDATIYYTLDGSEPNENSTQYSQPINITSTTVVRARTFGPNLLPSNTITNTYFINSRHTVPVISLSTTPSNFFDTDTGIYAMGRNYQSENPYFGANFWQDWECPLHVEFFEADGVLGFSQDAGVKISGGWSRANPQKPLSIFARSRYGASSIKYQIFPDRPFAEYEAFMLKNGGNDWGRTFFSDAMMHELVEKEDLEIMAFRPCIVYLNGEYWGIYNLREKQNEHYLAMYFKVNPDSLDLLEFNQSPIHGDASHYAALIDFVTNNNLQLEANYQHVKTMMDVDNFITYMVAEIYFDNRDWPGNNIKYWRPKTATGRWRWLLYDTDWGFGLNAYGNGGNSYVYDYNTLAFATSPTQTPNHHGNPPWSTLLLRTLLTSTSFKNDFINRFADCMNTIFLPDTVTRKIIEIQQMYESEMPDMIAKWGQPYPEWSGDHQIWWHDLSKWYEYIQIMIDFANNRIPHMRNHIISKFSLSGSAQLTLNVSPAHGGQIKVSTITVEKYPWRGNYFLKTPVPVTALPNPNYEFDHWEGLNTSRSNKITIEQKGNASLTAVFKPKNPTENLIVINEINYNSSPKFDPEDWIELYNNTNHPVDFSGWQLKDLNNTYIFPNNTVLDNHEYLVLSRDTASFRLCFPQVQNVIGNLSFGLNGDADLVLLQDNNGNVIDSVSFKSRNPWPLIPNGGGPTLELKNPDLDNSRAVNWKASLINGTPGTQNDNFIVLAINPTPLLPKTIRVYPNYPNPFNSATVLRFELPESSPVNLHIYNLRGQLVEQINLQSAQAGYQEIDWSAKGLGSGIYLYKIVSGKYTATGKCLLLK